MGRKAVYAGTVARARKFDTIIGMRVTNDFLHKLDQWRAEKRPIPTRGEAVRRIVEKALAAIE